MSEHFLCVFLTDKIIPLKSTLDIFIAHMIRPYDILFSFKFRKHSFKDPVTV